MIIKQYKRPNRLASMAYLSMSLLTTFSRLGKQQSILIIAVIHNHTF